MINPATPVENMIKTAFVQNLQLAGSAVPW